MVTKTGGPRSPKDLLTLSLESRTTLGGGVHGTGMSTSRSISLESITPPTSPPRVHINPLPHNSSHFIDPLIRSYPSSPISLESLTPPRVHLQPQTHNSPPFIDPPHPLIGIGGPNRSYQHRSGPFVPPPVKPLRKSTSTPTLALKGGKGVPKPILSKTPKRFVVKDGEEF
ncbi:hypothetical protein BC829DRAFT_439109 [Chytridium lagenaria]|nr:hypothetical protein BC829DRAFT_439109 [Chytridium lagenaria]